MKKITQKQMAFYKLYKTRKEDKEKYVPTWQFVGELYIPELSMWGMMSYKCPTRLTDIYQENPNLLERRYITGKSGSKYYEYRIKPTADSNSMSESSIIDIYKIIRTP